MKTSPLLKTILTLIVLLAATGAGYAVARLLPDPGPASALNLPPRSRLDLPTQTQNGVTASVESYYADAARLFFAIRVDGDAESYALDQLSIKDSQGEEINSGYGIAPSDRDPSLFYVDIFPVIALIDERLDGQLSFNATGSGGGTAAFRFDLTIPVYPALAYNLKQSVWANGLEILLDRLVITPAYTQAYLCYIKPTGADWMIGSDTTLRVNGKISAVQSYGLLFDDEFGDIGKGGEAD